MMPLVPLRRLYNRVRRKIRRWRSEAVPYRSGLPQGLDADLLNEIVVDHFDSRASSFSHKHLSAWKSSGAYRVQVRTSSGKQITLVFKESRYGTDEIPALTNLPIRPGLPEYVIYSRQSEALAPYLPKVYLAQQVIPNLHYRYLLEDLSTEYYRAQEHNGLIHSSGLLPELHQALQHWARHNPSDGLLRYGQDFSSALQKYIWDNLQTLYQHVQHPVIKTFIDTWGEIKQIHTDPQFFRDQSMSLIHGDANFSNIHINKSDPARFKIVDWEWAGFAPLYADLASLLKGTTPDVEAAAFQRFTCSPLIPQTGLINGADEASNYRLYLWCKLERGLLDAAFLASQSLNTDHQTKFNLQNAVIQSLNRVQSAYHQIAQ